MRLIVADEQELFREGVKGVLSQHDWVDVVGEAGDADALSDLLHRVTTDAVVLDLGISDGVDIDVVTQVRSTIPGVMVVALISPDHVDGRVRKTLELGCQGCLLKNTSSEELVAALRTVSEGHHYIQGQLIPRLVDSENQRRDRLSPQHLTVLQYLAEGVGNREIATVVGVSETTLKSQLRLIYSELGVTSRVEAVATGLREGMIK
jgi:DNA-binding NarL/FixJ family response regulator